MRVICISIKHVSVSCALLLLLLLRLCDTFVFPVGRLTGVFLAVMVSANVAFRHDVYHRVTPSIVIGNVNQPHVALTVIVKVLLV